MPFHSIRPVLPVGTTSVLSRAPYHIHDRFIKNCKTCSGWGGGGGGGVGQQVTSGLHKAGLCVNYGVQVAMHLPAPGTPSANTDTP